jgi:hypothetical protein
MHLVDGGSVDISQMHAWGPPKLRQLRSLRQTDWNVPFVVRWQQGGEDWRREGKEEVLAGSLLYNWGRNE